MTALLSLMQTAKLQSKHFATKPRFKCRQAANINIHSQVTLKMPILTHLAVKSDKMAKIVQTCGNLCGSLHSTLQMLPLLLLIILFFRPSVLIIQ